MRKGNFDVGFRYERETSPEFGVLSLHTYALHIVGPVQWKTRIEQADWKEIAAFPWIWLPEYCPFSQIFDAAFRQRHLEPCQIALIDQEATIKILVTSGIGLALMVEDEALASEQERKIALWKKDALQVEFSFIYLRKREHDPMMQAILNGLLSVWHSKS